jgi:hypothetical protein
MKTKDVRTLPPERRELAKPALSFKNKYRNDSDIAVVRMILALYEAITVKVVASPRRIWVRQCERVLCGGSAPLA